MIVVSNTSPLTNLVAISQFSLLHSLFPEIFIAEGVWNELNAQNQRWPGSHEVATADWIYRKSIKNFPMVSALQRDLDRGEAETIALAIEINASLVLMDEQEGRHAAQRLGLKVIGVVGVLLEAKRAHLLSQIRSSLDALRQHAGFYLKDSVYRTALRLAGEETG